MAKKSRISKNLIKPKNQQGGGFLNCAYFTDDKSNATTYVIWSYITEFIPVVAGEKYTLFCNLFRSGNGKYQMKYYNSYKKYLGTAPLINYTGINEKDYDISNCDLVTIPAGVEYIRLGIDNEANRVYFGQGETLPSTYEPYGTIWEPCAVKQYHMSKTIESTDTLPITINADGNALLDYRIYGNAVQNGTPTPDNPIMPSGCGELETTGVHAGQYKLPILSNSAVTNIYLGESQTTRRIKKLVLTGNETWSLYTVGNAWQFYTNSIVNGLALSSIVSNIAEYGVTADIRTQYDYGAYLVISGKGIAFQMRGSKDTFVNIDTWKAYLAAQYANGTPITVWYVLAEPETGIVNEPLMKIGDYADTIDSAQATVQIPTIDGTTIIDYDGTPKPSQMYIKYNSHRGWEPCTEYVRRNGVWVPQS